MNIMEQQIWDYLDGSCSLAEKRKIDGLIALDSDYRDLYAEIKEVHDLMCSMELDEPSMSFTRNVMDSVSALPVAPPIRTVTDKRIIYGIAAFFLFSIVALLALVFTQINWALPAAEVLPEYAVPRLDYSGFLSGTYLQIFLFADVILGLYILDSVMRKKMFNNQMR